jgi:hypothetical protein
VKKKHFIIAVYTIYVLFLFVMASYYQYLDELPPGRGFFNGFLKGLEYASNFFLCCLFGTWLFFTAIHFIHRKLSVAFVFLVPLLHFMVSLLVYLTADFILWISQLRPFTSDFQKGFLITSVSSTIIMIWFLGDVFETRSNSNSFIE